VRKYFRPLFFRGLLPVESDLGESSVSRLGIGWSTVFSRVEIEPMAFVKIPQSEIACPDSRSKHVMRLSGLKRYSLRTSFSEEPWDGGEITLC